MRSVKGKQWIKLIRRDPGSNFIITKNTKICSEHFVLGDFCSRSGRRYLKQNAVPSVFPWKQRQERLSSISKKALQSLTFANDNVSSPNYDASSSNFDADLEPDNVELGDSNCCKHLQREVLELLSKLTETEHILADTQSKLADTQCKLVDSQRKLEDTQSKLEDTQSKLEDTEINLENKLSRSLFRLENIKCNNSLVHFYTGLSDYETLMAFYEELLEPDAKVMRQWSGCRSECSYEDIKVGKMHKLPLLEQFFMTLIRL